MNCFQKLLSSWWRTTLQYFNWLNLLLWIAFKNYYLRDEGQQATMKDVKLHCCELLSKIIIFVMKDNQYIYRSSTLTVVNCFQKLLSSWWRTTYWAKSKATSQLWIAFKNYYLRDEGQQKNLRVQPYPSCELLSKIIIFVMKDNKIYWGCILLYVVNCFQKLLSSWWRTTHFASFWIDFQLWIAFKNYYLRDEGQQTQT